MKIEIRLENGQPIIFFPNDVEQDKTITCFTLSDGHNTATRAYMRSLAKPTTKDQISDCLRVLHQWCQIPDK